MESKPKRFQAIEALVGKELSLSETSITEEEIDSKLASMISDWETQAYARNRQADYPDTGAQFNKIYDDGVDKWKTEMVDPVKAKWPKDNSGPK